MRKTCVLEIPINETINQTCSRGLGLRPGEKWLSEKPPAISYETSPKSYSDGKVVLLGVRPAIQRTGRCKRLLVLALKTEFAAPGAPFQR